jgi:hypothetical protein
MTLSFEGHVFECTAIFLVAGQTQIQKTHLIFVEGFPFAVLEWAEVPGGMAPAKVAKLDPGRLQVPDPAKPGDQHSYRGMIRLPEDVI